MINNKWFCEPDELRESWCFLSLEKGADSAIGSWEIGYGNPSRFVRKAVGSRFGEPNVIRELLRELFFCRRKEIPIVTFRADCIPVLRTRILLHGISNISLRGLRYVCIEEVLGEFFDQELIESGLCLADLVKRLGIKIGNMSAVELLWTILLRLGPLLPEGVI